MKAMQILLLGATLVVSSAYANEVEKEIPVATAKNIVVADNFNYERSFSVEQQTVSAISEKKSNAHNVLNTKFLGKRPYMETSLD